MGRTVDRIVVFPPSGGPTNKTAFPRDLEARFLIKRITDGLIRHKRGNKSSYVLAKTNRATMNEKDPNFSACGLNIGSDCWLKLFPR